MLTVYFDARGTVHLEFAPPGETVNPALYLEVLKRLKRHVVHVWADIKDTAKLRKDHAPSHMSFIVANFLAQTNTPVIPYPPYSPDLAPCDFLLFPRLKRALKGKHWKTKGNIHKHVTMFPRDIPVEHFQGTFQA